MIEELITVRPEISDKESYYNAIVSTIIETQRAGEFIVALSELIQRLTVDHLHIVGDIFDRGPGPHTVSYTHLDVYKRQPIQCADKRYDNKFLAEIRDKLHKFIKKRSSYSF